MTMINLNADIGESYGRFKVGDDEAILKLVDSASIACGFHGGDPTVMANAVRLARENGVSIGAHPSFNDLWGFGRRPIQMDVKDLEYMIAYQIGALAGIAAGAGMKVTHVKPHGALNNMAHTDPGYARAIARAIKSVDRNIIFVANTLSEMVRAGHDAGLRVAEEAYIDRTYDERGALTSRREPDAVIHDVDRAVQQVLSFLDAGAIVTRSGKQLPARIHTFCCHGDEGSGAGVMSAVRTALVGKGARLVTLPEMDL